MQERVLGFVVVLLLILAPGVSADEDASKQPASKAPPKRHIVIRNVDVFDGVNEELQRGVDVLVGDNLIVAVQKGIKAPEGAAEIDGGGRFLMPGLHDMHTHVSIFRPVPQKMRIDMDPFHIGAVAAARARGMLMNGFTLIRDIGGPAKYLQRVVDAGLVPGPRVLPTEAFISQTSGHGDFRNRNDVPHPNAASGSRHFVDTYFGAIADGVPECIRATRESLRLGATQIKIMGTGGVASEFDPLHGVQFLPEEIRAIVETAKTWKTYVASHCFTDEGIRRAVENGVMCIEHGPLMSEESAKLLAEKGVWLVPSLAATMNVDWDEFEKISSPATLAKAKKVAAGNPKAIRAAVKHKVKMAFGTDLLSNWENSVEYDREMNLEFKYWAQFVPNVEALRLATSHAAELARLSGPNNPYQDGPTGVIKPGAYADLILIDGNPIDDIMVMTKPQKNFKLIMKDGVIYKNTLLREMFSPELRRAIKKLEPHMPGSYR